MKAVQIVKPNELRVIEMEKPTLDAHNNVLVKMTAAGICGSDVGHLPRHQRGGHLPARHRA